jgi:hypothetical protein
LNTKVEDYEVSNQTENTYDEKNINDLKDISTIDKNLKYIPIEIDEDEIEKNIEKKDEEKVIISSEDEEQKKYNQNTKVEINSSYLEEKKPIKENNDEKIIVPEK